MSNYREKQLVLNDDTLLIDTLSIIPSSEVLKFADGELIVSSKYTIDYAKSTLIIDSQLRGKEVSVAYKVFPILFTKPYQHKTLSQIEQSDPGKNDYFTLKEQPNRSDLFSVNGLNKNGSISRGINFGNNQNLSVNSNLDLQLSGKISDDVSIQAAISDNNLPIQADGNTQQLQEFDRVFIKLYTEKSSLIAGDFRISRPQSYFMNFNKKVQGAGFSTEIITKEEQNEKDNGVFTTSLNAAISRGKFSRNVIQGIEGNQGPYKLVGDENEQFIIVLSGTERVFVNGKLMTRGQDNDYVIDYNTAELTFTPNQIINKDQRIVIEFQYSEQNYSRSVFFVENNYKKEKLNINLNVYSEQDNKNQPFQQDLTDEEKLRLIEVGDSLDNALVSGVDSVGFEDDQVRYKLVDSLGQQILVYSINPDSALYAARFRLVGNNLGDYVQIQSDANGRVFQFVAPINGVKQGNYDPNIILVSPKQRQMFTLGADYQFSDFTKLSVEGAFTRNDLNTFSSVDSDDDDSYGFKLNFDHKQAIVERDSTPDLLWKSNIFYEQRGENFQFIERYRGVEFERDWNILNLSIQGEENLINASTGFQKGKDYFNYNFGLFKKGVDYEGLRNGFSTNLNYKGLNFNSNGSYLSVNALDNSNFLRHYSTLSQKLSAVTVGVYLEQEKLEFFEGTTDSLLLNSQDRIIWKAFAQLGDTTSDKLLKLSYGETYEKLPDAKVLRDAHKAENFDLEFSLAQNPNSRLSGIATYRKFLIEDDELTVRDNEETILGRLQYDFRGLKGLITTNTFYQLGSGLEYKREFSFIQVNDGQGTHLWNDYNNNDVKEFNEFEIAGANNTFQANYIKVFTPTNEFVRVFSNQFNQVIFLKPNAVWSGKKGVKNIISKFSNKAAYRAERNTGLEKDIYNPFKIDANDTSLVSLSSSFSNTFYFNRINPKFGAELFYLNNTAKTLLTSGFQSRRTIQQELRTRYNVTRTYSLELNVGRGTNDSRSEFFANRDYTIETREIEPKLIYQPSIKMRISFTGFYSERVTPRDTAAYVRSFSTEFKLNQASKGSFSLTAGLVNIAFNADQNTSLAFEMLDGLTNGNNITWGLLWQRNLANNLQLNINYNGRKSNELKVIHTGGMQVRAFF